MNYQSIYDKLIDRSKLRMVVGYVERHHIVPKCLGGSDDESNIAVLTAREHFVAHQLLVKIHPSSISLIRAANMMTVGKNNSRVTNRKYEWLKIRNSQAVSIQNKERWEIGEYREKMLAILTDSTNKENFAKGRAEYWANPDNRKRQGDAAKRSNSTRWLDKPKPEKVIKAKGPQSPEARERVAQAKRDWWAKKKETGEYKEACENISNGTKVAMQNPIVRSNLTLAISARWK